MFNRIRVQSFRPRVLDGKAVQVKRSLLILAWRVRGAAPSSRDLGDTCRMYPRPVESAPELFQLSVTNVEATVMGNIWMCSDCK